MEQIRLQFSECVVLHNAMQELGRHQSFIKQAVGRTDRLADQTEIIADMTLLREVDTSALAVILQLDRESRRYLGRPMAIVSAPEELRSLARLTSIDALMNWQA